MKIKFSADLMRKLCEDEKKAGDYFFPIKSNGDQVGSIYLTNVVKWDWRDDKTGPTLKQALENIVTAAYEKGRKDERIEIKNSLNPLKDLLDLDAVNKNISVFFHR